MSPLLRELVATWRPLRDPEVVALLEEIGLRTTNVPMWGIDRVSFDDGWYDPDPEGFAAVIVGVYDEGLIDLVATDLASRRIARRTKRGAMLGQEALDCALDYGDTLHLRRDPIEWLQHRGTGAAVLDWRTAPFALTQLAGIACTTARLAAQVDKALREPLRVPPLFVREARRAAA